MLQAGYLNKKKWTRLSLIIILMVIVIGCSKEKENEKEPNFAEADPLWTYRTEGRISSSPIFLDGSLYFGSDDGHLYAVNAHKGTLKWKFQAGGAVRSTVTILNNTIYFLCHDGNFYAVDAASGEQRWIFPTGTAVTEKDPWDYYDSSAEISDGLIYFGSSNRQFYALDLETGAERWRYQALDSIKSSPTSDQESVYFGDWLGNVYSLNKLTGDLKWTMKTDGSAGGHVMIQAKPAVDDKHLYVAGRDYKLYALDKTSGNVIWKQSTPAWVASPLLMDGTLYVGNSDGFYMEAKDAETGDQKWIYKTENNILSAPSASNGVLYFSSGEGYSSQPQVGFIYAVDMKTGKELGKREGYTAQTTPVVDGDMLYYTTFDGNLYAVKLNF